MPDLLFHSLTVVVSLVGLWVAYWGVSIQLKSSQETNRVERERQHRENQVILSGMKEDIAIIKTELRPLVNWWNGGPAGGAR